MYSFELDEEGRKNAYESNGGGGGDSGPVASGVAPQDSNVSDSKQTKDITTSSNGHHHEHTNGISPKSEDANGTSGKSEDVRMWTAPSLKLLSS